MTTPRYPDIEVQLSGQDGSTGAIMGRVAKAMRRAEIPSEEISAFRAEVMSGDYNNVLATCFRWVTVS